MCKRLHGQPKIRIFDISILTQTDETAPHHPDPAWRVPCEQRRKQIRHGARLYNRTDRKGSRAGPSGRARVEGVAG